MANESSCSWCRHWHRAGPGINVGHCHRRSPAIGRFGRGVWPETKETEACGNFDPPKAALPMLSEELVTRPAVAEVTR